MDEDSAVRFAILATQFDVRGGTEGEIFGFLYFREEVPPPGEARKLFGWDLLNERCCQVSIKGTDAQIDALLRIAAVSSGWSFANSIGIAECIRLARESNLPFGFDNLEEPTGRSLPIEVPLQLTQGIDELANRLENVRDQLDLRLNPDWEPRQSWSA